MICKECGIENNDSAKFCKACGAKLEMPQPEPAPAPEPANVFCQQCGTENSPTASFCKNCGSPLTKNESATQSVPQSEPQRMSQSASTTIPPQSAAPAPDQTKTGGGAFHGAASTMNQAKQSAGPKITELLKMTFTSPVKYIEKASEDANYWLASAFVVLVSSFLIAIIAALRVSGNYVGYSVSPIGPFFIVLIVLLICQAANAGSLFISEKIFGGKGSFKNVIGGMGPSLLFAAISGLAIAIFASSEGGVIIGTILGAIATVLSEIVLWKAHEVVSGLKDAKMVYSLLCYMAILIIVILIIASIAGGMLRTTLITNLGTFFNGF